MLNIGKSLIKSTIFTNIDFLEHERLLEKMRLIDFQLLVLDEISKNKLDNDKNVHFHPKRIRFPKEEEIKMPVDNEKQKNEKVRDIISKLLCEINNQIEMYNN